MQKKLIIFASGSEEEGGSGFQHLVEASRKGLLEASIVAVVSNHQKGGVWKRAQKLDIPFEYFSGPYHAQEYRAIVEEYQAEWVALSGWLKLVRGLDATRTINIHPGPLPQFGGKGMYGEYVHKAVLEAYHRGEVQHSEVVMHFVTERYDEGPIFFRYPVPILENDTSQTLGARVNAAEHEFQSWVTNLVVQGHIRWDGVDSRTLGVPPWYIFHKKLSFL